jgi:hypothetical protein
MQHHEQHDPKPGKPNPGGNQTKLLLFVIAVLVGIVASQVMKRFM